MTRLAPLLIFLVFAAMAAVMLLHEKPAQTRSDDYVLPELRLTTLDGESKEFDIGKGISVLNFFASWCAPCLEEHKQLIALKKKFPEIMFHGVAWNDSKENIEKMLAQHGTPYDALWADGEGSAAIALGIRGIPETFIVKNGRVIYHIAGPILPSIRTQEIEPLFTHE